MNRLFKIFELDYNIMSNLIKDDFISGSSCIFAYLISIGKNPKWEPNDIDIYVKISSLKEYKKLNIIYNNQLNILKYFNEETNDKIDNNEIEDKYIRTNNIYKINTYTNGIKKIQVIFTFYNIEEIIESFDLSICEILWNPLINFKAKECIFENISNLEALVRNKNIIFPEIFNERIKKYEERGFKIIRHNKYTKYNLLYY
jgi:hypothetical protein